LFNISESLMLLQNKLVFVPNMFFLRSQTSARKGRILDLPDPSAEHMKMGLALK
jgi:hypothetical protein